jgi:hypothetical protein
MTVRASRHCILGDPVCLTDSDGARDRVIPAEIRRQHEDDPS